MDATASEPPSIQCLNIPEQPIPEMVTSPNSSSRHCFGDATPGEFPLSAHPSIVLHVLTSCNLDPQDLAKLEATCSFLRQPAQFAPDYELCLPEVAALDMCQKRAIFKPMTSEKRDEFKLRCGGSWKLVLKFLLAGEAGTRREKSQAIAGSCHSVVVTSKGSVYTFGSNASGQLGHGTTDEQSQPRVISSLQGIRIIHAVAGVGRTMLISDSGQVYTFGKDLFGESEYASQGNKQVNTPQLVESLKDIFVVQATIGKLFTAVLSREGRVYTFSWGNVAKLGHYTDPTDVEPRPLLGPLENIPVVQIAAGYCYLLALAWQPSGMSVYSVGCGQGGKLGHGNKTDDHQPTLIQHFQTLNVQPMVISAGAWHAAVLGTNGKVCTWGWGNSGCLGHGNDECQLVPKVVESLSNVKAVHVATGEYTTFVVSDDGDVYSFGYGGSLSLGHDTAEDDSQGNRYANVLIPKIATSLKEINERVVQISLSNSNYSKAHTFALTETGKLYAFGAGNKGQLGMQLLANQTTRPTPERVELDLS
ncbi:ultraviolet-B receptor UVR8-like [Rutidosis leptorrhynchoides]|uniref:ultraviolet-B receptor UVR8-like n=1 Tax=Rutidosis leptorrhynchoides TaxID=125765 RepID=UPI003A994826